MIDKAGFDFKAIPRGGAAETHDCLTAYIAVFRVITGASERSISYDALGNVGFLSTWRRGLTRAANLDFERYEKLVAYMDRKLIEKSGVPFERLGGWIQRQLSAISQEQFEAAQVPKSGRSFKKEKKVDDKHRSAKTKARSPRRQQERREA
jgi:hypothetical protein